MLPARAFTDESPPASLQAAQRDPRTCLGLARGRRALCSALGNTDLRQGQAEAGTGGLPGGSKPFHQPLQGVLQLVLLKERPSSGGARAAPHPAGLPDPPPHTRTAAFPSGSGGKSPADPLPARTLRPGPGRRLTFLPSRRCRRRFSVAASRTSCSGLAISQRKSRKARPCRSTPRGSATTPPPPWPSSSAMLPHVGPPSPAPPLPGQRGPSGAGPVSPAGPRPPVSGVAVRQGRGCSSAPRAPLRATASHPALPSELRLLLSPALPSWPPLGAPFPLAVSQPGRPAGLCPSLPGPLGLPLLPRPAERRPRAVRSLLPQPGQGPGARLATEPARVGALLQNLGSRLGERAQLVFQWTQTPPGAARC